MQDRTESGTPEGCEGTILGGTQGQAFQAEGTACAKALRWGLCLMSFSVECAKRKGG